MYNGKRVLIIIPARGGSKGLPGKNIKEMNGKPLIYWTIKRAQESKYADEIYISTDSQEIADICYHECNQTVDELRPEELAKDSSSSLDLMLYIINHLMGQGKAFDYVMLLEPTSPLRKQDDIDNMIQLACKNVERDGVISLGEVHMEHPAIVKIVNQCGVIEPLLKTDDSVYQRQQLDKVYFPYGVAYLVKTDVLISKKSIYTDNCIPYFIERWQTYEVDDIYDFMCIERIMKDTFTEM